MNPKAVSSLGLAVAWSMLTHAVLAEEPCNLRGGVQIMAHTCEGLLEARIDCGQLHDDQVWKPDEQDRPNLPPKRARDAAREAVVDAGLIHSHESAGSIRLSPCGSSGGWIYLVEFQHSDLCGDSAESKYLPVVAVVLMDGQTVIPENKHAKQTTPK